MAPDSGLPRPDARNWPPFGSFTFELSQSVFLCVERNPSRFHWPVVAVGGCLRCLGDGLLGGLAVAVKPNEKRGIVF